MCWFCLGQIHFILSLFLPIISQFSIFLVMTFLFLFNLFLNLVPATRQQIGEREGVEPEGLWFWFDYLLSIHFKTIRMLFLLVCFLLEWNNNNHNLYILERALNAPVRSPLVQSGSLICFCWSLLEGEIVWPMATALSVGCLCIQRRPAGFSGQLTAVPAEVNKQDQILTLYQTQGLDVTHNRRAQLSALHLKSCYSVFVPPCE